MAVAYSNNLVVGAISAIMEVISELLPQLRVWL